MTQLSYDERDSWPPFTAGGATEVRALHLIRAAVIVGLAYYVGSRIGFALTLKPSPVSTLWPPNAILLAAFLLTARSSWWAVLGGAFVAHLIGQLQSGIPMPMVLGWFVTNASEGLLGATLVRHYIKGPIDLSSFRQVSIFVTAAFLGTSLSSFLDAGMVSAVGRAPSGFWDVWLTRTPGNVLASLTLVPVILTWSRAELSEFRATPARCYVEASLLVAGLLAVCAFVFVRLEEVPPAAPVLLAGDVGGVGQPERAARPDAVLVEHPARVRRVDTRRVEQWDLDQVVAGLGGRCDRVAGLGRRPAADPDQRVDSEAHHSSSSAPVTSATRRSGLMSSCPRRRGHAAAAHHVHALREPLHLREVVRDEQHGQPAVAQRGDQLLGALRLAVRRARPSARP